MAVEQHSMPADASETMIHQDKVVPNADNVEANEAPSKQRPDWLADKFESPEAMAKAYYELEKKLGSREAPPEELTRTETPNERVQEQPDRPQQEEGQHALLPGLDNSTVESISDYAWEHQSLTDEHYQTLEKAGYSRDMVDQFMQGQFAIAADVQGQLIEAGGGEAQVESMFNWARNNMNEQQIAAYDEMFDRGGPDAIMAMENLRAKYESAGGNSAWGGVQGANAPSSDQSYFESSADVIEAMSDPRYQTNPTYRAEVMRKLQRSNALNGGRA